MKSKLMSVYIKLNALKKINFFKVGFKNIFSKQQILVFSILIFGDMLLLGQTQVVQNLPSFDQKKIHFGFTIGTNFMNFSAEHTGIPDQFGDVWYTDLAYLNPGFHVSVLGSYRLGNYFNLRVLPGVSFGQRDMYFVNQNGRFKDSKVSVKSTYIDLPVLIKYKAVREGNYRPFMIAGVSGSLDLARSKKSDILLRPWDYALEFGVGSDFYLMYFRFGVEAKMSIGLADILNHNRGDVSNFDPRYMNAIDRLSSNIFTISFNFE